MMKNVRGKVKKAIIPMAGMGTRFLPFSKILPKELWPLVDKPIIQYIIEEIKASGIKEIIFIKNPRRKISSDYLEKFLEKSFFSYATQNEQLGDGHAILQAEKMIKDEPFAVSMADDVVESKTPCLLQMMKVYEKLQKPILVLYKLPKEKLSSYGIVGAEPIIIPGMESSKIYRIKKIVEKPAIGEAPSDLAIGGKYILTPGIFSRLKKTEKNKKGEIILAEALQKIIEDGEEIYGYQVEGKWLECGNKPAYMESNLYLSLKHPEFGQKLRKAIKKF